MKKDKERLMRELEKIPHEFQDGYLKAKAIYVLPLIDQLDEPEKVAIPQFVADWISNAKIWGYSISDSMGHVAFYDDTTQYDKAMRWANKNQDIFARAWLDGYEVEKEKLYQVIFPTKNTVWKYYYLDCDGGIDMTNHLENVNCHTEYFIRSISDDLWTFAVEVES